jgi:hypothetical protein
MSGISPSYHYEFLVMRNGDTNIIGSRETTTQIEGRKRALINGKFLLFAMPLVGIYRFSTGFIDAVQGAVSLIFSLKKSELFLRGSSNMIRGTVEMIPLSCLYHFCENEFAKDLLNGEPSNRNAIVKVGIALHLTCLTSLLIYDKMLINYYQSKITGLPFKACVELFHDSVLVKTLNPISLNKLTYEEWIEQINNCGKTKNTDK